MFRLLPPAVRLISSPLILRYCDRIHEYDLLRQLGSPQCHVTHRVMSYNDRMGCNGLKRDVDGVDARIDGLWQYRITTHTSTSILRSVERSKHMMRLHRNGFNFDASHHLSRYKGRNPVQKKLDTTHLRKQCSLHMLFEVYLSNHTCINKAVACPCRPAAA